MRTSQKTGTTFVLVEDNAFSQEVRRASTRLQRLNVRCSYAARSNQTKPVVHSVGPVSGHVLSTQYPVHPTGEWSAWTSDIWTLIRPHGLGKPEASLARHVENGLTHLFFKSRWARDEFASLDLETAMLRSVSVVRPGMAWYYGADFGESVTQILFVGNDFIRKGGVETLRAAHDLKKKGYNLRLTVCSNLQGPSGRTNLDAVRAIRTLEPDRLIQPSRRRLVDEIMPKSDLFIMPSLLESFGYAAVEAKARGLPLITTDVPSLAEINLDGKTGYTIPVDHERLRARHPDYEVRSVRKSRSDRIQHQLVERIERFLTDRVLYRQTVMSNLEDWRERFQMGEAVTKIAEQI